MFQISENEIKNYSVNVLNFISELKEQSRITEIDLFHLFSYTLMKYSTDRYLNNHLNIINLLKTISIKLLVLKHGVRTEQQALEHFNRIKSQIIIPFNNLIKRKKYLFDTLRDILIKIIDNETSDIISDFTSNKLKTLDENLDLLSFIINVIELAVRDGIDYNLQINEAEYLKNITFLENSYPNQKKKFFRKEEQFLEILNFNMGTLNYLANHILNKEFNESSYQVQITYKLTNNIANKILNPKLSAKREHIFNFWKIGDELIKLGIGYWYPYFTKMNDSKYNREINANFIIPTFTLNILNRFKGEFPTIDDFQENLKNFDFTKISRTNVIHSEVSHNQIKDFIAAEPDTLEEGWFLVEKEYETGSVGKIDILFKNEDTDFLVIEVKKETARYEPVGQILNYINWIKSNKSKENTKVRGIIVCGNIHPQLKSAFEEANNPDLQIWKYGKLQDGFKFEKSLEIEGKLCPYCGKLCSPRALNCPGCGDPF